MASDINSFPIHVDRVPDLPALTTPLDADELIIWKQSDDTTRHITWANLKLAFFHTNILFSAASYQNNILIGLTAMINFNVFSNDGSGVLLKVNDGYTFNSGTGTITIANGDYLIMF